MKLFTESMAFAPVHPIVPIPKMPELRRDPESSVTVISRKRGKIEEDEYPAGSFEAAVARRMATPGSVLKYKVLV